MHVCMNYKDLVLSNPGGSIYDLGNKCCLNSSLNYMLYLSFNPRLRYDPSTILKQTFEHNL